MCKIMKTTTEKKEKVVGLTAKQKTELKAKARDVAMEKLGVSKEEQQKVIDALKIAKMPIEFNDKDFKLGEGEVDIRKLSPENKDQIMFRMFLLSNLYLKDLTTSFVDTMKLLMVLLHKLGVDNISKAIEELEGSLREEIKQKLN